jgi:putative transcriptional regulator
MPHCVPAELLLAYSAGTAPEPVALLVATHLALCPECRGTVQGLDEVGGAMMGELEPAPVDGAVLDGLLSRLDEPERPAAPKRAPPPEVAFLPEPLRSYVGDAIPWQRVVPGIWKHDLPLRLGAEPVRLTRLRPGLSVPTHSHRGVEMQLVLQGGYTDGDQDFRRGDVQVGDDDLTHGLTIDAGEDCITLLVKEHPLVQKTWRGRFFAFLTGV